MALRKAKAVKAKAVDLKQTRLNNQAWTDDVVKVSNNIANQFETPILFYTVCIVAFLADAAGGMAVYMAWGYVALRYVHAYIHITSNFVPYRMRIFALSLLLILALLVHVAHTLTAAL
jgi:hypothetical protein